MSKKSRWGLIYREFYISKDYLKKQGLALLLVTVLILLPLASFKYGNLRLINSSDRDTMFNMALIYGKYIPIFTMSMFGFANFESEVMNCSAKWRRYQLVTPLSGFQFAFYKYAYCFLTMCVMSVLATIFFRVFDLLFGGSNHVGEMGILVTIFVVGTMTETITLVYGMIFGSMDKAGMAMIATILPVSGIGYMLFRDKVVALANYISNINGTSDLDNIELLGTKVLPYAIVALIVIYMIGMVGIGMIYKRREK